jgi:hypothetical protein
MLGHLSGRDLAVENCQSKQLSAPRIVSLWGAAYDESASKVPARDSEAGRLLGWNSIQIDSCAGRSRTDGDEPSFTGLKSPRDPEGCHRRVMEGRGRVLQ